MQSRITRKFLFTVFDRPKLRSIDHYPRDAPGTPHSMNIQEHLSAFDGWLTSRLEEAHARRKDLAFRDLAIDVPSSDTPWEYSLLEPGGRSPQGEGWSVYRLHGVWPEATAGAAGTRSFEAAEKRSFLGMITSAVFGREAAHR